MNHDNNMKEEEEEVDCREMMYNAPVMRMRSGENVGRHKRGGMIVKIVGNKIMNTILTKLNQRKEPTNNC